MNKSNDIYDNVKFVKYTGKYPNLCSGVLTLEIDGVEHTFGYNYHYPKPEFDQFWCSGGDVWFDVDWNDCIEYGGWKIHVDKLPEQFRKYAEEIEDVLNDNIPLGCCGGCL